MEWKKLREKRKSSGFKTAVAALLSTVLLTTGITGFSYGAESSAGATDSGTLLLSAMGVITADSSGSYNLNQTLTRAEFAKMLVMASVQKDSVQSAAVSSPFKDVTSSNWAAPYVKLAAASGYLSGYSDGTFRPNNGVTLEQAVNSVLKLQGYTEADFTGAFPYAQMNIYNSNGLSANITGGIGTIITKKDGVNLIYNLMGIKLKDGSKTYAESLGYSLNDSGEVNYAGIISDNMSGPITVKSSDWYSGLGMSAGNMTVYKNGSIASLSDVKTYDIVYYSKSKDTAWVYDDRITGVYEKATPNQNAATAVTVSGKSYTLESTAAFSALSSSGNLKIGEPVTLLLGKNGGVADAVSSTVVSGSTNFYVTETGTKTYQDTNGNDYTSQYIKGVKANGTEVEYAVTSTWAKAGDAVAVTFDSNGKMSVQAAPSGSVEGKVDSSLMQIGSSKLADSVQILDTFQGSYSQVSSGRLDGVTISSDDVLYYAATNGKITELILNNVTGDSLKYGVVTSAKSNKDGDSLSGTYVYDIKGISETLATQSSTLSVHAGPAYFYGADGKVEYMKNLMGVGGTISEVTEAYVTADNVKYLFSADVMVYTKDSSGNYKPATVKEAVKAGSKASYYYDDAMSKGGRVRVIVIPQ